MAFLASVSQFLGKTFALWVLVFAGLAYVSPDSFKFFAPYISPLLGIIMFGIGLTLKASDFSEVFRRPMAVAIGTLGQFTIMMIAITEIAGRAVTAASILDLKIALTIKPRIIGRITI